MADEKTSSQNTATEQANAPKDSGEQQVAQKIIGEGSAASGSANPTQGVSATALEREAKAANPLQPAVSSTQASGGLQTKGDSAPSERAQTPIEKKDTASAEAKADAAAEAGAKMITLHVDGREVSVPEGTLVIEAALRAGADLPYFCYHPRLTSVGACRMCLANVELMMFGAKRTQLLTCCTVPVTPDIIAINTKAPEVKKAQNGMLEFLLANHPLDCPICDRGGECPLQNMTIAYGPPTSRYIEEKRHFPKAKVLSDYVVLDRERCIQCMRCTRFTEEISGDGALGIVNRGAAAEIGVFEGASFDTNFSGNTIEICPVGALTSRTYRFSGRPWEIRSTDTVCGACGNGCNVAVQTRLGELVRVNGRTNEEINEEWTCDRGKFKQYYINDDARLSNPLVRRDGVLVETTWDDALSLVAERMRGAKETYGADSLAAIGSTVCTLEENYLLGKLMRAAIGSNNLDHRMRPYPLWSMQTSIAAIENFRAIVSVGMDLRWDQPIVFLRVQKAKSRKGATWLAATAMDDARIGETLRAEGENAVLLLPHTLTASEYEQARAICDSTGAKLNVLLPDCNSWGAVYAGVLPDLLPGALSLEQGNAHLAGFWGAMARSANGRDTASILDGAVRGDIKFLYILGSDPATQYHQPERATAGVAGTFTVVQDLFLTETAKLADVVLPAASFAERDGTFVNIEGREQKIRMSMPPKGNSRPDWQILADLLARLGMPAPYFSARDVYREYTRAIPKALPQITAASAP